MFCTYMSYLNFFNSDPTPNPIPAPQPSQLPHSPSKKKTEKTKKQVWESLQAAEYASRYRI